MSSNTLHNIRCSTLCSVFQDTLCSTLCSSSVHIVRVPHNLHNSKRRQATARSVEDEAPDERWGAGVETQKNVRGEIGGWGRVPFNEPYAPSLSTIYDEA